MVDDGQLLLALFTASLSLVSGVFVLSQDKRNHAHMIFFCLSIALTFLTIANYFSLYGANTAIQELGIRIVMMSTTVSVFLMYLLFRHINNSTPRLLSLERFMLVFTVITMAIHFTNYFVQGVEGASLSIKPIAGTAVHIFIFHFILTLLLASIRLVRGWLDSKAGDRLHRQYKILIVGFLPSVLVAPITGVILPIVFGWSGLVAITPIYPVFFLLCIGYSIIRHGLFDIRLATVRTIGYILSLGFLSLVYIGLAYLFSVVLFQGQVSEGVSFSPINIILALVLAFIFQPVKQFFDKLTNNIFYRSDYNSEVFFREFGKILSFDTDLKLLLRQVSAYISKNLKAESVFFYIADRGVFNPRGLRRMQIPEEDIDTLTKYYFKHHEAPEAIVLEMVGDEEISKLMLGYRAQIMLPLVIQKQPIGYLFIGDHKSRGYTARDIRVLESVTNELTIAIQNSLSVEEIRDLNESLQRKVDEATAELRSSNRQLQRLDEAKNEFISMASHQLRTPLTSIKGYLDMVLQGDLGRVSSTQRTVLSEAYLSSERMVALINDFLNVSRLQTGKFNLEKRNSDLTAVVQEQVQMLGVVAKQHGQELKVKLAKNLPKLEVDEDKIRQVIVNFIDNAIYYSPTGSSITVELSREDDTVVFKVTDKGIGVPKSEQAGLFTKFYRATNARKKRPDGTGVGLFLAKKVVVSHGGKIIFESLEGQGSTFGFSLPIEHKNILAEREQVSKKSTAKTAIKTS